MGSSKSKKNTSKASSVFYLDSYSKLGIRYFLSSCDKGKLMDDIPKRLPFEKETVEAIVSEYGLPSDRITYTTISEFTRVLKPGGRLSIHDTKRKAKQLYKICIKHGLGYCSIRKSKQDWVVSGVKPYIINITEKKEVVGLEIKTSATMLLFRVMRLNHKYEKSKYYTQIENRIEPRHFYSLYVFSNEKKRNITYFIGEEVRNVGVIPPDSVVYQVPKGEYAVFTVMPGSRRNYPRATLTMKKYIYETWLAQSYYSRLEYGIDIEFYDERSEDLIDGEFEILIPVKREGIE